MSFTEEAPSVDVLNGGSEAGPATPKVQATAPAKAKVSTNISAKAYPKETIISPDKPHSTGESPPAAQSQHTVSTGYTPHDDHPFDPIFGGILPVLLLILLLWAFWKFMVYSIRKNPPYGGYAHKHKRMHPGVPNPTVFKSK